MGEQLVFLTDITISILSSLSTGLNCFDFWKSFSRAVKTFKIVNTSLVYHQSPQNAQQWYRCLLVVAWSLQAVRIFVDQDCDSEVRIYVDQDCNSEVRIYVDQDCDSEVRIYVDRDCGSFFLWNWVWRKRCLKLFQLIEWSTEFRQRH